MKRLLGMLIVTCVTSASTVHAGELVNDTKHGIAIQQGIRDSKTGAITWSGPIILRPGFAATIAHTFFYRYDTHVRDGKVTWSLPAKFFDKDPRDYFFLFGTEVLVNVVRK